MASYMISVQFETHSLRLSSDNDTALLSLCSVTFVLLFFFFNLWVLQEMSEDPCTPKEEKQERLSRHKETMQRSQAEEEAHLLAQQRLVYDRSCRALKRRSLVRRHEFEQEQMREVM